MNKIIESTKQAEACAPGTIVDYDGTLLMRVTDNVTVRHGDCDYESSAYGWIGKGYETTLWRHSAVVGHPVVLGELPVIEREFKVGDVVAAADRHLLPDGTIFKGSARGSVVIGWKVDAETSAWGDGYSITNPRGDVKILYLPVDKEDT